jgi:SAM-dependent methyltransferase
MELAKSLDASVECPVLDVGAGSGRNTLPLAKLGFSTDAVEVTPALARILREEAAKQHLKIQVFDGDVLDDSLPLPQNHYRLVVLAEVLSHFRSLDDVRRLFVKADKLLRAGGFLLFNSFVARAGYEPNQLTRQVSQLMWSCLFTDDELREASSGLSFELVSSEPACEYEKARLPAQHWPPTAWFEAWSAGTALFDLPMDKCPMQLRWFVYRKTGSDA